MSPFDRFEEVYGLERKDMVFRNFKVGMNWERNMGMSLELRGKGRTAVDVRDAIENTDVFPRGFGNEDLKMSGMLESFSLPSELMSFALTYEKAYNSSIFLDCWTTQRTLSRIDIPIRMVHRPKTKLECLTCKVRRVKCDERKPTCLRCQKMGIKCGGYNSPQRENRETRNNFSVPRPAVVPTMIMTSPQSIPEMGSFKSDREYHHFKIFSQKLHREGGNRVLLQICQTEPLIRRTILALAVNERLKAKAKRSSEGDVQTWSLLSLGQIQEKPGSISRNTSTVGDKRQAISREEDRDARRRLLTYIYMMCFKDIPMDPDFELSETLRTASDKWAKLLASNPSRC